MSLSKVLSIALIVALSHANAVPPTPSAYPLSKPCAHEWQYLNFNPNDAKDKAHLQKLHDFICNGELRAVVAYGKLAAEDFLASYTRYFPSGDEETDSFSQVQVEEALNLISEEDVIDRSLVVDNFGEFVICAVIFLGFHSNYLFDTSTPCFDYIKALLRINYHS